MFNDLPPWLGGALMATFIAILRVVYDRQETSFMRIVLEGVICGSLTVCAGSALTAMGYDHHWYLFCGGTIGFMGSQTIRALAIHLVKSKNP